ncbi:hypothetical protein [Roseivirga sp.]|uniref:hypothetical protein n=1 Tax=Roseivirga sp. TaxID=1964215 RepID=UPI003B527E7A
MSLLFRISVLGLVFFCLINCSGKTTRNKEELSFPEKSPREFSGVKKNIVNKQAKFLGKIIDSQQLQENGLYFYYSGYDCGNCVQKGFEIIRNLSEAGVSTIPIAFQTNIGQDQIYYDFKDRIYIDQGDYLHDNFSFIPTPFFMITDEALRVVDIYIVQNIDGDTDSLSFFTNQRIKVNR